MVIPKSAKGMSIMITSCIKNEGKTFTAFNLATFLASKGKKELDKKFIPYLMATIVDTMIEEEVCLNLREDKGCLVISIDRNADVIDCKEFFEAFYHLATGFNYDTDTGIPEDQTEAEMYLTRLQEEFDEKMKGMLGDTYLPGNNDPDTINAEV